MSISSLRIFQAAWTILSIYFAILIAAIAQNAIVPLSLNSPLNSTRWWIVLPTLFLFILSTFETYLWLNPREDKILDSSEAGFHGLRLLIYLVAIIGQTFLLSCCSDFGIPNNTALFTWSFCMGVFIGIFCIYNLVGVFVPYTSKKPMIANYIVGVRLYAPFSAAFIILSFVSYLMPLHLYGALLFVLSVIYFSLYIHTWRKWYFDMLAASPTDKRRSTGGDTDE